jgi:hypothetical protein
MGGGHVRVKWSAGHIRAAGALPFDYLALLEGRSHVQKGLCLPSFLLHPTRNFRRCSKEEEEPRPPHSLLPYLVFSCSPERHSFLRLLFNKYNFFPIPLFLPPSNYTVSFSPLPLPPFTQKGMCPPQNKISYPPSSIHHPPLKLSKLALAPSIRI